MIEIFTVYAAISLVLIPIFRIQGAVHGYSEAKEYVFIFLSALAFMAMLFTGIPLIRSHTDWIFLSLISLITLSVYWSDAPSLAVKDVPRWWAIFFLYLACRYVPRETLMIAFFLPAPVIVAYGLWQQLVTRDPLDHWVHELLKNHRKKLRFYSFLGNSNYTGSYLVGTVFAGVYCTANFSLWFAPFLAFVIVGIAFTRCRGAWIAVVCGFLGVIPDAWPMMVPIWAAMLFISWRRWETAKTRIYFLNVGWTMLKERLVFGWGPNAFRRKIFKTQAYMNQQNPRLLGTLKKRGLIETPLAKRMHNDHAEMFVEYGLAGALLWLSFIVLSVYQAVISGQWYVAGGIIAISVNALFFYPVRVIGIGIGLWVFLAASVPNQGVAALFIPPLYMSIPFFILAGFFAWEFGLKRLRSIYLLFNYHIATRAQDKMTAEINLKQAMVLDPLNGNILSEAGAFYANTAPPMALSAVMKSLDLFDGEKIEWSIWVQLGNVAVLNGAAEFARVCFKMAIYLNPSYEKPYKCLEELNQLLKNLSGQKDPEGFKEKDGLLVPDKNIVRLV